MRFLKKKKKNHFIKVIPKKKKLKDKIIDSIEVLSKINFNISFNHVMLIIAILGIIGIFIGVLMKNIYLSMVLSFSLPLIFIEYLFYKKKEIERYIDMNIITVAETIKNNYISTLNINNSIKTSLERFPKPLDTAFEEYLKEVEIFNFPIETALKNLSNKFDSNSLDEFIKQLILCDKDSRYVTSLNTTVSSLNDRKVFMNQWAYIEKSMYEKLIVMIVIVNGLVISNYFAFPDMIKSFVSSDISKPIIAIYLLAQVIIIYFANKSIKSIKL